MRKKYKLLYTVLVVFMNEIALALYNMVLKTNAFLDEVLSKAIIEVIPAFIFGVIVEYLLVSRVMEFISDELKRKGLVDKNHKYLDEVLLSVGMVLVVTLFGLVVHGGLEHIGIRMFIDNFLINLVFAVPFFILVIHPVAINIMRKLIKE